MRYWFLCLPLVLAAMLLAGCGPFAVYPDIPMINLSYPSTTLEMEVDDPDGNGWDIGQGTTTKEISVELEETAGKKAFIERRSWSVRDEDGNWVTGSDDPFVPVKELDGGATVSLGVKLRLTEWDAHQLDIADGDQDMDGVGTLRIQFMGYDERNIEWSSTPLHLDFEVKD